MSSKEQTCNYTPLSEPIPVTEQQWPEDVVPLVTIRTMAYNHEKFIRECIEGVLIQKTTFPIQYLIHDDASTDNTAAIIKEYAKQYPNVIRAYYQTENSYSKEPEEKSRLRQMFFRWIQGKYVALCEGDDYWIDSMKLQKQINQFDKYGESSVISYHPVTVMNQNKKSTKRNGYLGEKERIVKPFQMITGHIPTVSAVIRLQVFEDYPEIAKYSPYGDAFLWAVAASKGKALYYPEAMAVRRKHDGGVYSSLQTLEKIEKSIITRELMLKADELTKVHHYIRSHLLTLHKNLFYIQTTNNHKFSTLKSMCTIIVKYPFSLFWFLRVQFENQIRIVKRYSSHIVKYLTKA